MEQKNGHSDIEKFRELIKDIYARYAYAVDSLDIDLVRSVFAPDCVIVGTMEQGSLDDYLVDTCGATPKTAD